MKLSNKTTKQLQEKLLNEPQGQNKKDYKNAAKTLKINLKEQRRRTIEDRKSKNPLNLWLNLFNLSDFNSDQ